MKPCNVFIACLICTYLLPSYALATGNIAAFNVTVPPQQFKALRVKNLPRGASVSVEVISNGEIAVAFVDADDYRRLPKPKRPLMAGKVKNRLTFSVVIPADGHYYVVLVNPHAASAYDVTLTVRGERPKIKSAGSCRPHMQTKLLLGLRQRSPDWADIDRVKKELAKRQVTSPPPERTAPEKEIEI